MGLKKAILCGCLVLVAGRTVTIVISALSLTEESQVPVCFKATAGQGSIELGVFTGGKQVITMIITVSDPPRVCKKVNIPDVKELEEICVQMKNVDLKTASGCVYLSYEWNKRWITNKVRCFKIPKIEGEKHEV